MIREDKGEVVATTNGNKITKRSVKVCDARNGWQCTLMRNARKISTS